MSLRARLLLGAGLIAVVLAVAAVAIVHTTRTNLLDQVDAQLDNAGDRFPAGFRPGDAQPPQQGPEQGPDGATPALSSLYIGRLSATGELLTLRAPNLRGDAPIPEVGEGEAAAILAGQTVTVGSTDPDVDYRMQSQRPARGGAAIVLALPLDDVQESVRQLVVVVLAASVAVLAVLSLVIWWVIHLGVRPVQRMTATAGAIAAGDLSQRVTEGTQGTEAGDLAVALNGMLGRIEEAFDHRTASEARLRQFVADASHELRTPVATIRGYAELYRTGALAADDALDDAMRRTEEEAVRMGSLVDDLLQLARLDQGRPLDQEVVDLGPLVEDAVRDARAVEPDGEIRASIEGPVRVVGDQARLHQVLANLLANARVHAPGAAVEVRVRSAGDRAIVEVADDGPGMEADEAARAFERFYRADASRSRHHGGSGLGLSIVDATIQAHGGTVSLDSRPGGGTVVRIELPACPDPADVEPSAGLNR